MKKIYIPFALLIMSRAIYAAAFLEIDVKHEIDMRNGLYIAKEYEGQGRYALISHSHGRFEGGDIAQAVCTDGFVVSQLPTKFSVIQKFLKPTDFVLTKCKEDVR